jgi:hypothetical protein
MSRIADRVTKRRQSVEGTEKKEVVEGNRGGEGCKGGRGSYRRQRAIEEAVGRRGNRQP